jgi:hypothetical protein
MKIETKFYAELIDRFLDRLDFWERKALGDEPNIQVSYVEGDPKQTLSIVLSPLTPILHVKTTSKEHQLALELSVDRFIKAAAAVGFKHICIGQNDRIEYAYRCRP